MKYSKYLICILALFATSCAGPKLLTDTKVDQSELAYGQAVTGTNCVAITPDYLIRNNFLNTESDNYYLAQRNWRWNVDETITIRFVDTPTAKWGTFKKLQVEQMLEEYYEALNQRITFDTNPAVGVQEDHRWTCTPGSAYMILGSVVRFLNDKTQPTGNFGLPGTLTIRHELAHMMNLGHAHQAKFVPWNTTNVYRDTKRIGWSQQQADFQIINQASEAQYEKESYDLQDFTGYRYFGSWRTDGVSSNPLDKFLDNHYRYFDKYYPPKEAVPEPTPVTEEEIDCDLCEVARLKAESDLEKKSAVINRIINSYLTESASEFFSTFKTELGLN